jgi:hypothetical protein
MFGFSMFVFRCSILVVRCSKSEHRTTKTKHRKTRTSNIDNINTSPECHDNILVLHNPCEADVQPNLRAVKFFVNLDDY